MKQRHGHQSNGDVVRNQLVCIFILCQAQERVSQFIGVSEPIQDIEVFDDASSLSLLLFAKEISLIPIVKIALTSINVNQMILFSCCGTKRELSAYTAT